MGPIPWLTSPPDPSPHDLTGSDGTLGNHRLPPVHTSIPEILEKWSRPAPYADLRQETLPKMKLHEIWELFFADDSNFLSAALLRSQCYDIEISEWRIDQVAGTGTGEQAVVTPRARPAVSASKDRGRAGNMSEEERDWARTAGFAHRLVVYRRHISNGVERNSCRMVLRQRACAIENRKLIITSTIKIEGIPYGDSFVGKLRIEVGELIHADRTTLRQWMWIPWHKPAPRLQKGEVQI
jgi:hypothetical protein